MSRYYLFVDESGTKEYKDLKKAKKENGWDKYKPSERSGPVFTLGGILISEDEWLNKLVPEINKFKLNSFNSTNIILRRHDMITNNIYSKNRTLFKNHILNLTNILSKINFSYIPITIIKPDFLNKYIVPADPYKYTTMILMERTAKNIPNNNLTNNNHVYLWGESRTPQEDNEIKEYGSEILKNNLDKLHSDLSPVPFSKGGIKTIRKLRWHIHFAPKKLNRLQQPQINGINSKIPKGNVKDLSVGLEIADILVGTTREHNEAIRYPLRPRNQNISNIFIPLENLIEKRIPNKITYSNNNFLGKVLP